MPLLRLSAALTATAFAALALGVAGAANKRPVFVVDTSDPVPAATTEVELSMVFPGSAPDQLSITGAPGYTLPAKAVGEQVGVAAFDVRTSERTLPRPLVGVILVADPATSGSDPALQACAPGTHDRVWELALRGAVTASVPIAVDTDASGATRLTFCLAALRGAGVAPVALTFGVVDVQNPVSPGIYRWSAVLTPFDASGGADPGSATDLRADVPLPQRLTVRATFDRRTRILTMQGVLTAAGKPEAGRTVHLYKELTTDTGSVDLGTARTNAAGTYVARRRLRTNVPAPGRVIASVLDATLTCSGPSSAPDGCTSETRTGADAGPVAVAKR